MDGDALVAEVEAEAPSVIEPGKRVRFEAAYSGEGLKRIRELKATVTCD